MRPKGNVDPNDAGCWFCYRTDGEMVFDKEWDTHVHVQCIRDALEADPEDPEALCMTYILDYIDKNVRGISE